MRLVILMLWKKGILALLFRPSVLAHGSFIYNLESYMQKKEMVTNVCNKESQVLMCKAGFRPVSRLRLIAGTPALILQDGKIKG